MSNITQPPTEAPTPASKSPATSRESGPATSKELAPKPILRNRNGQFLPGNTANPKGRPKGSLNRATIFARALLEESAPAVARKAINEAISGNPIALKLVLERLVPVANDRRVQLDWQSIHTRKLNASTTAGPEEILDAHNHLLRSVADGELSPLEAQAISQLLEARRRSWESLEISKRLAEIEDRLAETKG